MSSRQYDGLRRIAIKRPIIEGMLNTMREFGAQGCELLVLWVGDINLETGEAQVIQAFVPQQRPIKNEIGVGYFVGEEALFNLNRDLSRTGLRLIAQVHSHPQEAYHSEADDRYAIITAQGGLSLVIPNFGDAPADPVSWAVYRLHGKEWLELTESEICEVFFVQD